VILAEFFDKDIADGVSRISLRAKLRNQQSGSKVRMKTKP